MPATSTRSLIDTGMPCSGPRYWPAAMFPSARAASASARSAVTVMKARSSSLPAAMRSRQARVSSTGESSRRSMSASRFAQAIRELRHRGSGGRGGRTVSSASRSACVARASVSSSGFNSGSPRASASAQARASQAATSMAQKVSVPRSADRDHVDAVVDRRGRSGSRVNLTERSTPNGPDMMPPPPSPK